MDRRRRPDRRCDHSPPPPPATPSSSLLRDVSNFKTPRTHPHPHPPNPNPNPSPSPLFFTASKKTPSSSSTARLPAASGSKAAARRLKVLEIEQSRSSRTVQIRREKALKSFSKSVAAWLNLLFRDPAACGARSRAAEGVSPGGKRESLDGGGGLGGGGRWRSPKRQRRHVGDGGKEKGLGVSAVSALKVSLKEVCSYEDLRERMEGYMSKKGCDEVLLMMSQVCKNIDEGRLKMKAHCPIVTDLGQKEKAIKVLMSYHPMWLRIGLHIVFGGESLLNESEQSDNEDMFLRVIIEKQFFSHMGIARSYAYNKLVEGLYRPGYTEALGNVILKRFMLLVISLDKAKCDSTLLLKYGIDGMDGGSTLLFNCQSHIKSSRQVIREFLFEAMHGEGDLLAHLLIMGCKVIYQQLPLAEYEFNIRNLFEDLQDGIMLCRAIQLLQSDASILSKVIAPSDTRKKNLQNCSTAIQYLRQVGVPLSDGDGVLIVPEDIVNGDKELTLSILWNMFVHFQVPLLVEKASLVEEIIKIKGSDVDIASYKCMSEMGLLLAWIQSICERQHINVSSFSSLIDGKAFCCLIDYYFGNKVKGSGLSMESHDEYDELIRRFNIATPEIHNFAFFRNAIALLLNIPEVLQMYDILDQDASYDERSVVILLLFVVRELIHRKNLDQLTTLRISRSCHKSKDVKPLATSPLSLSGSSVLSDKRSQGNKALKFVSPQKNAELDRHKNEECAARIIQFRFKGFSERNKFLKIKMAISLLQTVVRAWLAVTSRSKSRIISFNSADHQSSSGVSGRHLRFMIERHMFLRAKKSVLLIQHAVRAWIRCRRNTTAPSDVIKISNSLTAATVIQSSIRGHIVRTRYINLLSHSQKQDSFSKMEALEHQHIAAIKIQLAWRGFAKHKLHLERSAATIIQSHWRGWCMRKNLLVQVGAIMKIQAGIRCLIHHNALKNYKLAAIEIQRFLRGQCARNRLLGASYLRSGWPLCGTYNQTVRCVEMKIVMHSILKLQRWWKQVLLLKHRTSSMILIQSSIRGWSARRAASKCSRSISVIQRWWRNILVLRLKKNSVILIQAHCRGWITRRAVKRDKQRIVIVQSYWRGYLVRKGSRQQILDLWCRMQKSAANVDEDMRIINRLVAALSELLGSRSISSIRHTCATLNIATEHSHKCCETLVNAGAVGILLKQLHSLNRGIPDQEVLKHILSTLQNIIRYRELLQVLVETPHAVEIIFQEFLRNKSEGFLVACDILKKICTTQEGLEAIRNLHGHLKRLSLLVQDLERKIELQKRNPWLPGRESTMQRLREAMKIMILIADGCR